jgi:elongation factor Ts
VTVEVSAQLVKQLREATGAGFQDCRKALLENDGDVAKATEYLRKKGIATAAKKSDRAANEGIIQGYMHHNGRLAVIVEVNSETDFVARNEKFKQFAKELALHIANLAPKYVKREEVPQADIDKEREIQRAKTRGEEKNATKPDAVIEKIVDGRMDKWFEELVLLEQGWLHDDSKKVGDVLTELIAEIKENLVIKRFARFAIGEDSGEEAAQA